MSVFIIAMFTLMTIMPPSLLHAGQVADLPEPGTLVFLSKNYEPPLIKGVSVHQDDPFQFDFIVDNGDAQLSGDALKEESSRLIKYFLAALTISEQDLWVNLSPLEQDRITTQELGVTEMGRDLLAQDYLLKQIMSSLTYPEDGLGKTFWERVFKKTQELYGTTDVSFDTFNKVWIIPDGAEVYETGNSAFVVKSHLKVMLDEDYLALKAEHDGTVNQKLTQDQIAQIRNVSSSITREVLIPEIEREVNEGEHFARVRQIYNSVILANWYKQRLKESILGQIYVDQNKVTGVDVEDKAIKQKIYEQYVEAFKKGVYNYIREDYDQDQQKEIPRKYFSGGMDLTSMAMAGAVKFWTPGSGAPNYVVRQTEQILRRGVHGDGVSIVVTNVVGIAPEGMELPGGVNVNGAKSSPSGQVTIDDDFETFPEITDGEDVRVAIEHDDFVQVSDFKIPRYEAGNPASVEQAAERLLVEVYKRLTIFGGVNVKIEVGEEVFQRFERLFNNPEESGFAKDRGYWALGDFLRRVYGASRFGLNRVEKGALADVKSTEIRRIEHVNKEGSWVGLDIGGSDLKAVIVQDGKLIEHRIEKWSPKVMTDPYANDGHLPRIIGILEGLLKQARDNGFDTTKLRGIGVSINLVVVDNKIRGTGPVVQGLKGTPHEQVMNGLDDILQEKFRLPVSVMNDGDAAALQTSIDMGLEETLALAGGTGLAMGYGSTELLTEGGNIRLDNKGKNASLLGHSYSKVPGVAQQYVSQRVLFELAKQVGIDLSRFTDEDEAGKLVELQRLYGEGDPKAIEIFSKMPKYLATLVREVKAVLPVKNVVLFGRITKGAAGEMLREEAERLIKSGGLDVNVLFPKAPEGVDQKVYLEVGQAVGATYYAAYRQEEGAGKSKPSPSGREQADSGKIVLPSSNYISDEFDGDAIKSSPLGREPVSIGVSLGGTKIAVGLVNEAGQVFAEPVELRWREALGEKIGDEEMVEGIMSTIDQALAGVDTKRVALIRIAFAGPLDEGTGIVQTPFRNENVPFSAEFPLRQRIEDRFKKRYGRSIKVDIVNDAKGSVLGELSPAGKLNTARSGMFFIMGTGNNGIAAENGEIFNDGRAIMELGHNIIRQAKGEPKAALAEYGRLQKEQGFYFVNQAAAANLYEWVFTGREMRGDKAVKREGELGFEDSFSGPHLAVEFLKYALFARGPLYLNEFMNQNAKLPEGIESSRDLVDIVLQRGDRFKPSRIQRSKPLQALHTQAMDAVLKAISQGVEKKEQLAVGFVTNRGYEIGQAFAALIGGYANRQWIKHIVIGSGVGENFARPANPKDEDILMTSIRQGLTDSLKQNSAFRPALIKEVTSGFVRSDMTWEREILAATMSADEAQEARTRLAAESGKSSPAGREEDQKGGIDFNFLQLVIKKDGNGVPLPFNLQDPQYLQIKGLRPVIVRIIQPTEEDAVRLLGKNEEGAPENTELLSQAR